MQRVPGVRERSGDLGKRLILAKESKERTKSGIKKIDFIKGLNHNLFKI